jgi:hypothetical protein
MMLGSRWVIADSKGSLKSQRVPIKPNTATTLPAAKNAVNAILILFNDNTVAAVA